MLALGIAESTVVIRSNGRLQLGIHVLVDNDEDVLQHATHLFRIPERRGNFAASITILGEEFEVEHVRFAVVEERDLTTHGCPAVSAGVAFEANLGDFDVTDGVGGQFTRAVETQRDEGPTIGGVEVTAEGQLEFGVKHEAHVRAELLLALVGEDRCQVVVVVGERRHG